MKRSPMSLTLRLFLLVSALNILTMCAVAILGVRSADINISEEYDAQLITEASILWEILEEDSKDGAMGAFKAQAFNAEHTAPLLEHLEEDSLLDYAQWRAFRVWNKNRLVMHSDNADAMPTQPQSQGFGNIHIGNESWRVFSLHDPGNNIIVETYENLNNRAILQRDIVLDLLTPLLIMLPVLGLLFSFGVTYGLKSLRRLANQLAMRSPSDLSRLKTGDVASELKPLVRALNTMVTKLESSLEHEREFIDHAAHELRTPLSVLKLQAQLLAKTLKDAQSTAMLDELLASVDRTSRLVDQLLLLSRMAQQEILFDKINLHGIIKEVIHMHAVRIVDKNINLSLQGDETLSVHAQPELLRTLIGTLLDNAIKYTPAGGAISLLLEKQSGAARLSITDSGEGIPEAERIRVFDRFYRVSGTKQSGSGLGLSIASQIAQSLNAKILMETPEFTKGLRVVIVFSSKD